MKRQTEVITRKIRAIKLTNGELHLLSELPIAHKESVADIVGKGQPIHVTKADCTLSRGGIYDCTIKLWCDKTAAGYDYTAELSNCTRRYLSEVVQGEPVVQELFETV